MKKGFTLIELLAVIVILAIIAVIAVPIVLNIINESKDNAMLRSADMYLKAAELSIADSTLKEKNITDGMYKIKDGNICLNDECTEKLEVEVNGEVPSSGTITIKGGKISSVELLYEEKIISQNETGKLVYVDPSNRYKIGQPIMFNPGDGSKSWYVIGEDETTVTLMLTQNLGDNVVWYSGGYDNYFGPVTALEYLNSLTTNWTNVDPISSYSYTNNLNGTSPYGYQKLEITNGVTKLTHRDGNVVTQVEGISRARILTSDEVLEIAQKTNENLTEENLRNYIQRNLSAISELAGFQLTTVEQAMAALKYTEFNFLSYESQHMQIYIVAINLNILKGIEPSYDTYLPKYLYDNLSASEDQMLPYAYWTLSTYFADWGHARSVDPQGILHIADVYTAKKRGVRPVITVQKSKL